MLCIQVQIQLQHIYSWLTENAKFPRLRVLRHNPAHFLFTDAARFRHSRYLKLRACRRNVRIKPRTRSGYQICRNRRAGIVLLPSLHVLLYPSYQRLIRRS